MEGDSVGAVLRANITEWPADGYPMLARSGYQCPGCPPGEGTGFERKWLPISRNDR
jgi:hypothetical protein